MLLNRPGMVHSSFSDGLVLNARDSEHASIALGNLLLMEKVEETFLDKYLKGAAAPLLDQADRFPLGVEVERIGH